MEFKASTHPINSSKLESTVYIIVQLLMEYYETQLFKVHLGIVSILGVYKYYFVHWFVVVHVKKLSYNRVC